PARRRSGVRPPTAWTCARRGSWLISCCTPASTSAWVSMRMVMTAPDRAGMIAQELSQRRHGVKEADISHLAVMTMPTFRFAPSPNGFLHVGHAYSALLNHDLARAQNGRFLLRIEDIDATRCRPEYETAIYEDLAWLGMSWEQPVRRQS